MNLGGVRCLGLVLLWLDLMPRSVFGRCIESVLAQDFEDCDFEFVFVDDGSTDDTKQAVLSYENRLGDKLKYFYKENSGVADTRNFGISKACGDYILFIDADDYIDKDLIKNQRENLNKNVDLIKFKMKKVDKDGNEIEKVEGPIFETLNGQDAFNKLVFEDVLIDQLCIYFIKRSYWNAKGFKFVKGAYHEDFGVIPSLIAQAESVISTDVYGYYYVQSDNSIMRNTDHSKTIKKMDDSFMYYDLVRENIKTMDISKTTKENMLIYYTNSILLKMKELNESDRKKYIKEFKKRKMHKNIRIRDARQLIKRLLLTLNVNIYLNK